MNKLFKKGLVSLAAASVLATGAVASSDNGMVNANNGTTPLTYSSHKKGNSFLVDLNISEYIGSWGNFEFKITIPTDKLVLKGKAGKDVNLSRITSNGRVIIDANASNEYNQAVIALDLNGSGTSNIGTDAYVELFDVNISSSADGNLTRLGAWGGGGNSNYVTLIDASGNDINASKSGAIDENRTKVGNISYDSTANTLTLTFYVESNGSSNSIYINDLNLSAKEGVTGDAKITVDGDEISTEDVTVAKLVDYAAKLELDASTVPNIKEDDSAGTAFAEFNITIPENMKNKDGNITITLDNGKFDTGSLVVKAGGTTVTSDGNYSVSETRIELELGNTLDGNTSINFAGDVITTGLTDGTAINVYFSTNSAEGNFTSLSTAKLNIANVKADGVEIKLGSASGDPAKNYVQLGKTGQKVVDVNLSEIFETTFVSGGYVYAKAPSGYTFYKGTNGDEKGLVLKVTDSNWSANDKRTWGVLSDDATEFKAFIADVNSTTAFDKNDFAEQVAQFKDIKLNIPSDANDGDMIVMEFGYCKDVVCNTKFSKTVEVAKVVKNPANVELNATDVTAYANGSDLSGLFGLDINETVAGALAAGSTIELTLDNGVFKAENNMTGDTRILSSTEPAISDDNKSLTFTVTTASSSAVNMYFDLPDISIGGLKAGDTINLSVSGAISADFKLATLQSTATTTTLESIVPQEADGSTEVTLGGIKFAEGSYKSGLSNGQFKIVSEDGKLSLKGAKYKYKDTSGNWSTVADLSCNNAESVTYINDTMTCTLAGTDTNRVDEIIVYPKAIVKATAEADTLASVKIVNVSAGVADTSGLKVAYVGTELPALTVDNDTVDVEIDGSATVTLSGVIGTVSATDDNDNITVTVDGDTATIKADADATEGDTATVTFTDSLTGKTATVTVSVKAAAPATVVDALLETGSYTINGTFSPYDFADAETAFDWAYVTTSGNVYQLQGNTPSDNDVFGWKAVDVKVPESTNSWYMISLGDWDNDGSTKFDWALVKPDGSRVYKLGGVSDTGNFVYEGPLTGIKATVEGNTITFTAE